VSTRSTDYFGQMQESSEKFDYFVCGVAGALFAYIGQSYHPQKLVFGISVLEPISLLMLAASFFVGLKHLEMVLVVRRINFLRLDAAEKIGGLTEALNSGPGPYYNATGPEFLDREQTQALRKQYLDQMKLLVGDREVATTKAATFYRVRNALLFLGFLAIFLSKILQPYANAV
jgi:hypothetical protein